MEKYQQLIEKSEAFAQLCRDVQSERVAASYVLVSPDLKALDLLARLFVAQLVAKSTTGAAAERALNGSYIDMVFLPRPIEKATGKLTADDVAYLLSTAYMTPSELDNRFYILRPESPISELLQNKLLKSLEEPPVNAKFILLARAESDLLPTVLSRSSVVRLEEFPEHAIHAELSKYFSDQAAINLAASSCRGQVGLADKMASEKKYRQLYELALNVLMYMKRSPDILHYAALVTVHKDSLKEFIDFLEIILRDAMMVSAAVPELVEMRTATAQLRTLAKDYPPVTALKLLPILRHTRERIALNGNANSMIDELLFTILEVKAKCQK